MGARGDPLLDPAALEGLREIGGASPPLLAALRGTDADEVRRAAHTLKSNGATFGATTFSELCRELEMLAKTGDLAGAPDLTARIEDEYALVAEELRG
jgi:HPt (histidine-containing phosphotransfer) domain-containing protein